MAQLVEHILGKDEVPGPNPGSSSNETLVERRGLLVSMGIFRPHPFAAIFRKGCGLFLCPEKRFPEQAQILFVGVDAHIDPIHRSFKSPFFHNPFPGIILNILPYFIIIPLVANHMVVIPRLPNIATIFFIAKAFERTDKLCKR